MSIPAISLQGLTKRYGRLLAVSNLTLDVTESEIFGFLGLNGAGKTTTIRMLLDLLRPNSGSAKVLGHDCQRAGLRVRALVGYLPGEVDFYGDMTGREVLELLGRLQTRPVSPEYRRELQERFDLPDVDLRRKLREYSTGMKRKLCLIQAFQGDPPLLILDEPTDVLACPFGGGARVRAHRLDPQRRAGPACIGRGPA
ncbi:MAG: ABC transporter ATP-binding protein [Acidobacteriia bacterium]|nr:ABC transporter ATP-binding protein [Terriglobia bacterium]